MLERLLSTEVGMEVMRDYINNTDILSVIRKYVGE